MIDVIKQKRLLILFFIGFLLGIVYVNFYAIDFVSMNGIFNSYYLDVFMNQQLNIREYFLYLIGVRVLPLILLFLLGITKFHKVVVYVFVLWIGFMLGNYVTLSVVQLGVRGLFFGIVALMPHIIFYIPMYLILLFYLYQYPDAKWALPKTIAMVLCFVIGIILEGQINPSMLKWCISIMELR